VGKQSGYHVGRDRPVWLTAAHCVIGIVGSRRYAAPERVRAFVRQLEYFRRRDETLPVVVLSGGARGVDTIAAATAQRAGLLVWVMPAEWHLYGKAAGTRRNTDLVAAADFVAVFWDGESPGTKHTLALAESAEKILTVECA